MTYSILKWKIIIRKWDFITASNVYICEECSGKFHYNEPNNLPPDTKSIYLNKYFTKLNLGDLEQLSFFSFNNLTVTHFRI